MSDTADWDGKKENDSTSVQAAHSTVKHFDPGVLAILSDVNKAR